MIAFLRLWPTTASAGLVCAALVVSALPERIPDPSSPSNAAERRRIGEIPPSVVGPELRVESQAFDTRPSVGQSRISAAGQDLAIKETVDGYAGQLQYCYEKQLEVNPTLEGRIDVGVSVSGGAVRGTPYIIENTTGDSALADCVSAKIRRWRFPAHVEGDLSWPIKFRQDK